jgi:hypothetical protein
VIEYREILVSVFRALGIGIMRIAAACSRRADKFGYAVRWQWVIVVRKLPLVGPSSPEFAVPDMPHTAKSCSSLRDLTPVLAQATGEAAFMMRRFWRKAVRHTALSMNLGYFRPDLGKILTDTIGTEPNHV